MPQTSTIAFFLIVGFIVFITIRGELPSYLQVLGLGKNSSPANSAATNISLPTIPKIPSIPNIA